MLKLLSVSSSVLAISFVPATVLGEIKTDYGAYPAPPTTPTAPAAGGSIIDPVFGTKIVRITGPSDGSAFTNAYSYWPSFNKDSTRVIYSSMSGQDFVADFDPTTMAVSNKRNLFASDSPDGFKPTWDDVIWSRNNKNIIYGHTKLNLWAYNVATDQYSLVHAFGTSDVGQASGHMQQMSMSADEKVFAFTLQADNFSKTGHIAWARTGDTDTVGTVKMHRTDPNNVNEVHVDKSGRYVVVTTETHYGTIPGQDGIESRIVDLQTTTDKGMNTGVTNLMDMGHFAPGHLDVGHGTVLGHENHQNRLLIRNLATPTTWTTAFQFPDWIQSSHVSMLANDDWALVSTFGDPDGTHTFENELFLLATDGSGDVIRFAHHESDYNDYYDSPRANLSYDGQFVAFTSNWGNADGRVDLFVVAVPEPSCLAVLGLPSLLLLRRSRRA